MKITLLATIVTIGIGVAAQAMEIHQSAQTVAYSATGGCRGGVSQAADLLGKAEPCCDQALGCAQFLATTRVKTRHLTPRT